MKPLIFLSFSLILLACGPQSISERDSATSEGASADVVIEEATPVISSENEALGTNEDASVDVEASAEVPDDVEAVEVEVVEVDPETAERIAALKAERAEISATMEEVRSLVGEVPSEEDAIQSEIFNPEVQSLTGGTSLVDVLRALIVVIQDIGLDVLVEALTEVISGLIVDLLTFDIDGVLAAVGDLLEAVEVLLDALQAELDQIDAEIASLENPS